MPVAAKFQLAHWNRDNAPFKKITLTESNVAPLSLQEIKDFSSDSHASIIKPDTLLGYGTHWGSKLLRDRIAETLCSPIRTWGDEARLQSITNGNGQNDSTVDSSPVITGDDVLVTIGTSSANLLVLDYLVGPGDHVICQYPTYSALFEIPRRAGAAVSLWRMKEENRWIPDVTELDALVKPNTKMLILNNPNNPTGAVTPLTSLQIIEEFCKKHSIILFCDEIFRPLFHSAPPTTGEYLPPPPSALHLGYPRTIVTGSLSKAYCLPGLRIGWIATPMSDLLHQFLSASDYTTIAVSALDDQVAAYALRRDVRTQILARSLALCQENLAMWDAFVEKYAGRVQWVRPCGSGTGFLRVKGRQGEWVDDARFAGEMVKETGLLVVPGAHCFSDADGGDVVEGAFRGYMRVALGNKPERTRLALVEFDKFLESSK